MTIKIRHATSLDIAEILAMSEQFYPETPYWTDHKIPFDKESAETLARHLIKRGIFVVAQAEDCLVGMLGAHIVPFIFNASELICVEAIWWVHPDYRKGRVGIELVKTVDDLRKFRSCKTFQMMRVEGTNPAVGTLLERLGFKPSEYCYTKVD